MSRTHNLPNSLIVNHLEERVKNYNHLDLDLIGILNSLRNRVSQEIAYINVLFPEYTPHDSNYHIKNLFDIADKLLEERIISNLSGLELFVLAASLYGHDWGMAVSNSEKEYIRKLINETNNEALENSSFSLLPDEKVRFKKFCMEHGLEKDGAGKFLISDDLWAEYVRRTHAERSGQRVFEFLSSENQALATAVQRVCLGHWLDFSEIRTNNDYSEYHSVLNENVNLRALTIYVRLVDLLDVTADRTPYVLWKFVAPRNAYSKMEWSKHRAIHGLSFPPYIQGGRTIKISGETTEHDVYTSLQDLMQWMDAQVKGCNDLIAGLYEKKYELNIYHIDWSIEPKGFDATPIRIEFNHDKMLRILSEEIYDEDMYVFLRELLQNSIDAIKMRKELFKSKKLPISDKFGKIHVNVEKDEDNNMVIIWNDNGIGMDKHIIKNYLSVAGNSYYSSKDFERTGLKLDPISKFGIGILSCNTVSDYVEIETKRERYMDTGSSPKLKVTIPSFKLHFKIQAMNDEDEDTTGTTFKIYIDKNKMIGNKKVVENLNVTDYLSYIAGFVDIPIVVTENGIKTLIIHPQENADYLRNEYGSDVVIKQLHLGYDWESTFFPQDLDNAKKYFQENTLDIKRDLQLEGIEGSISYLSFTKKDLDYYTHGNVTEFKNKNDESIQIRKFSNYDNIIKLCPSMMYNPHLLVYRDGILLPNASQSEKFSTSELLITRLIVNISKDKMDKINIARTDTLGPHKWFDSIVNALQDYFFKKYAYVDKLVTDLDYTHASLDRLSHKTIYQDLNLPFLTKKGEVVYKKLKELNNQELFRVPEIGIDYIIDLLNTNVNDSRSPFSKWNGADSIICAFDLYVLNTPLNVYKASNLVKKILNTYFFISRIEFVVPPFKGISAIPQEVWSKIPESLTSLDIKTVLTSFIETEDLPDYECYFIQSEILQSHRSHPMYSKYSNKLELFFPAKFVSFPQGYNDYFGYNDQFININNSKARKLLKLIAKLIILYMDGKISIIQIGRLNDLFKEYSSEFYGYKSYDDDSAEIYINEFNQLLNIFCSMDILSLEEMKHLSLSENDFISIPFETPDYEISSRYDYEEEEIVPFGQSVGLEKV
ncbi:HD domain-containing protein [Priestia megaterium]|uniref:HD domain-containing protein n=1 Tax=Priestia megaterium TaxID=1404 RepID=UPI000BFCD2F6|nr:ATP-binding protein [Priestia megaterium]PGO53769.1 hypothetical protein CN981_21515 [Priestia megaterium]